MDRMTKWKLTPEIVGETLLAPEEVLVEYLRLRDGELLEVRHLDEIEKDRVRRLQIR